jgi:hypothetical protein
MNNKFDLKNYSLASSQIIAASKDYQLLETGFKSSLLLIKWYLIGSFKGVPDVSEGILRVDVITPLGRLPTVDTKFKCYRQNEFIQFLNVSNFDFNYTVRVLNPSAVIRSKLEIWEYNEPTNYLDTNNPTGLDTSGDTIINVINS